MSSTSIAVLPFLNLSRNPEHEYLCEGLSEEIIHALTKVQGLRVVSRRSSFFYKDQELPLADIASRLKVDFILEGSVLVADKKLRIKTQLVQSKDDFHFWSESWDRPFDNIFEIQDEISLLIADRLREQFGHLEFEDHLTDPSTRDLSAYEYDLKARFHFNRWNAEDVSLAIDLWQKALSIDSQLINALTGLADAYGFLATTQASDFATSWQTAVEYTQKALALDPQSAPAHYQQANIEFFTNADFKAAFSTGLKTVRYDPLYPEGLQFLAFLYMISGDLKSAEVYLKRALDRDPLNPETLFYQAYWFYRRGRYKESEALMESLIKGNPQNIPALVSRSYLWLMQGRMEALQSFLKSEESVILPPGDVLGLKCLAQGSERNKESLKQLEEEAKDDFAYQQHSYLFLAYVRANRLDDAANWLKSSLAKGSPILLLSFTDPLAEGFKQHPDFNSFHQEIYGLTEPSTSAATEVKPVDAQEADSLKQALIELMQEEEPYLNPRLSLRDLAHTLGVHPNHLSRVLNKGFGQNFNQFVNSYRLDVFKSLALDSQNAHISIIGLAYESGFNSKTVFNTVFKKEHGLSPKAWLDQNKS